ncbi:MAG: tetraacyldisaccharide 4'-kinase [Ramlibacter sp.]
MGQALQRAWLRRGALACLLWPVSLLFGALVILRRLAFRAGLLRRERVPVPVVVVGNVLAGGSGKTPVVIAVLEHLRARGITAGVVSRGYGRESRDCREVTLGSRPEDVGDEPLLLARRCAVPVFVASRRVQAARALLAAYPRTRVIVCDDGLQHLALDRDIEICVFDERGVGNGWLLPAGPLRESWPRKVDLVLHSGKPAGIEGFDVQRRLGAQAVNAGGQHAALAALNEVPVTAVAGIARPEAFFQMLREQGMQLADTIALPDHDDFQDQPWEASEETLVCTEKDAVKLWAMRPDAWVVALLVDIAPAFWAAFDLLLDAKLSSGHGPKTS